MATVSELRAKFSATAQGFQSTIFGIRKSLQELGRGTARSTKEANKELNTMQKTAAQTERAVSSVGSSGTKSLRELERALRRTGMSFQEARRQALAMQAASQGTGQVLRNMNQRLLDSAASVVRFNQATNNIQAQRSFSEIERAITQTRTELSMLGFGKTEADIQALEGRLYNFANVRMDNLRDQIKLTERALEEMKSSADASRYVKEIKAAEAALAAYKAQVQDLNAVQKMAEINGYNAMKIFGKDVFVKPLAGLERLRAQVTGFLNNDLAYLANKTYRTIDGAAKAIVGSADTVAEQRRKVQQLATTYQTLGTTINTRVTPYILMAGAAFGYLGAKYEEATTKFQAQTLAANKEMGEFSDRIADVSAKTKRPMAEVSKVFSFLKNQLKETKETISGTAELAFTFARAWDSDPIKAISSVRAIVKALGVDQAQASDILALALQKYQGDIEKATEDVLKHGNTWKKATKAGTEGATAFERMSKALDSGAIASFGEAVLNVRNVFIEMYQAVQPTLKSIGEGLKNITSAALEFARANPDFVSFVTHLAMLGATGTVLIGVLAPLAFGLLFAKDAFLALALATKGMQAGALTVLPPRVVQLAKRFEMLRNAVLGLPRILAGIGPALATILRAAPMALVKFIADFVRLNPLLTAFSLLGAVIIDNWDRVGPVLSQIWKDVLLAFKPLIQAFKDANGTVWPTLQKALESISRIAGTVLVDALKTIEPVIRAIALAINGDFKGAFAAFNELKSIAVTFGGVLGSIAIVWGGYRAAVIGATLAQSAFSTAQGIALTSTTLMTTGLARATGALTALRFAFISNPVGLAITGLSLAAGAATLLSSKTEEVKEVTLEQFDALNKQRGALENTVKEYDRLRGSIKLSEPDLLRYMDLQTKISQTTDPTLLAMYKDEQTQLAQKSGLTADQLERFFKVNSDLIQQAPATEQAISAQGNALAKSADAAKTLVAELAKKSQIELDAQKANANANLTEQMKQYTDAVQRSNALYQAREVYQGRILQTEREIAKLERDLETARKNGNTLEARALEVRLENTKGVLEYERNVVEAKATGLVESQKEVEKLDAALGKTKQIYDALINKRAQQSGINAEIGKEVDAINAALQGHIKTRDTLLKKKQAGQQLTAEQQKQLEKTEAEIQKLNEAKNAINSLKSEQEKVNQRIQEGTGEAKKLNENLKKQINKDVNIDVNDGKAKSIFANLAKPITKTVTIVENINRRVNEFRNTNTGVQSYFNNKPSGLRHGGGTVHELPKFHEGGSPALIGAPPKSNEVDVRLLRNEMVLTKEQQSNLFNFIRMFNGMVQQRITRETSLKETKDSALLATMAKAGQAASKYLAKGIEAGGKLVVSSGQKVAQLAEKALTPNADKVVSTTLAEIKKNAAAASKGGKGQQQSTTDNKAFTEAMRTAQFKFDKGTLSAQQYTAVLKEIDKQYAKLPEHHRKVNEAISKADTARTKVTSEQAKKQFEESKKWIDERKYYNELSLEQELAAWQRVAARYQQGTQERIEAEREIYRVKQELNRASFDNSKRWIDEQKYYNNLSIEEELAAWQRVQARFKVGTTERKEADKEVYRVRLEIMNKTIEDEYKARIDAIDRETKAVQEGAQRQREAIESRRDAALDSLKREEQAELDSLDRRQKAYERTHQDRLRMLDVETDRAIKGLQAQIDAIDRQGKDEDNAYKDVDRGKQLAELRKQYDKYKVSASAKGQKKAADLLKQIEELQTEIERDQQARRREQQKEALKGQIDDIKEAAEQRKVQWQLEFDRQKEWFEQEKQQRQSYYQQRETQLKASFDAELRALEESTRRQQAQLEQQKIDAENTRNRMLEDARIKARENLNIVENGQQQIINTLQDKNRDYYQSGQTLGNMFAYGLESSISRIREAASRAAQAVSNRLELHSPAKEGPLSTLNRWWNAMPETLLEGLDTRIISSALNEMVNPNLSFGSLGVINRAGVAAGSNDIKIEINNRGMFDGANFHDMDKIDQESLARDVGNQIANQTLTVLRSKGKKGG